MNEDANKHLKNFLTICTTIKVDEHVEEGNKSRLFSFTLIEDVEEWFDQQWTKYF